MNLFDFLEKEQNTERRRPYEFENEKRSTSIIVYYKQVKDRVQCNSQSQTNHSP